ncbi:hypothetical protein DOTSEDRAFT_48356 [Dothistroma septosporum NZE10]|uniref:Uncharacterized protein n=1 Tax=Dothistroma septosporum (strain NZE10 / CBS 128990) TaxID=675120 RepID=M2Y0Q1_DOTSN|nr:hypothetical protein DOTSEDRAFT_48356 [Dothistroma septosporum NZE10]
MREYRGDAEFTVRSEAEQPGMQIAVGGDEGHAPFSCCAMQGPALMDDKEGPNIDLAQMQAVAAFLLEAQSESCIDGVGYCMCLNRTALVPLANHVVPSPIGYFLHGSWKDEG